MLSPYAETFSQPLGTPDSLYNRASEEAEAAQLRGWTPLMQLWQMVGDSFRFRRPAGILVRRDRDGELRIYGVRREGEPAALHTIDKKIAQPLMERAAETAAAA